MSKARLLAAGASLYVSTSAAMYLYFSSSAASAPSAPTSPCSGHAQGPARFGELAGSYDSRIEADELVMFVPLLRRFLLRSASGRVLEVGAGTGRNLPYYGFGGGAGSVSSLTLLDAAPEMLRAAAAKASALPPPQPDVRLLRASAEDLAPVATGTFDTVVSTFTLCSYEDPKRALREMQRACEPAGRILLLEHGLGSYGWLNRRLGSGREEHVRKWGCEWDRDVLGLVGESGMEVESVWRFHFGTSYLIWARPGPRNPRAVEFGGVDTDA
ncbi:hypothetical protein TeGR_g3614 [Tetraparma gracilis]|uniref:Methyltransferase type 11 domain-containing protein n=1 Tax=Tetraparma gracilis TaxID=2962635 RepID=A0ABQ6MRT9_9STRA|nr:hypothetical protein TeGR_g3614 [Tetraparma gracilis]